MVGCCILQPWQVFRECPNVVLIAYLLQLVGKDVKMKKGPTLFVDERSGGHVVGAYQNCLASPLFRVDLEGNYYPMYFERIYKSADCQAFKTAKGINKGLF